MPTKSISSVDEYIAAQPAAVRPLLEKVRRAIRKAVPGGDEAISYQIAAYKLNGTVLLFFAGWKAHYSLYPAGKKLVAAFREELAPYEVNEKGTIRFPLSKPVPTALIARIAKYRATEISDVPAKKSPAKSSQGRAGAGGLSARRKSR